MSGKTERFLAELAADLRKEIAAIARMDSALVERDIAARRREAALGRRWANMRTKIQRELEGLGSSEAEWCKRELDCDIATMRRRVQLAKGWKQYEAARREAGNNGQYGLVYGLSLIRTETTVTETNAQQLRVRSCAGSNGTRYLPLSVHHWRCTRRTAQDALTNGQRSRLLATILAGEAVVWRRRDRLRANADRIRRQSGRHLPRG